MFTWKKLLAGVALVLMTAFFLTPATQAAIPEDIEKSVAAGLEWLVAQQQADGSWVDPWYGSPAAVTGFAVLKLSERAVELKKDPYDNDPLSPTYYEYADSVINGLDYLFNLTSPSLIYDNVAGTVQWASDAWHYNYHTSIVMMGIAAGKQPTRTVSGGPLNGLTYAQVMQYALNYLVSIQQANGGWGYPWGDETDNSNTGYTTLGLAYAQSFGVTIPAAVLTALDGYIDYIQNDVNGDTHDGGSGYESPDSWVNILKTGNLLFEMALVGNTMAVTRTQDALDYIERHWNDNNMDPGWMQDDVPHYQAAYTMMKGFVAMGIDMIDLDGDNVAEHDWFAQVSDTIIANQNADGSWSAQMWGGNLLSTVWALLTLEKVVEIPQVTVPFDIKPTSCPNPFNFKAKGVLPAAILGTDELDVTMIDPASLKLVLADHNGNADGVTPLRWAWEDVAAPYMDDVECGCTTDGPDSYMDLTIKFDNQEVAAMLNMLNGYQVGDVVTLAITGNLLEEYGSTPIRGQDCVVVRK